LGQKHLFRNDALNRSKLTVKTYNLTNDVVLLNVWSL